MKSFTSIIAIALPLTIRLACVPIPVPAQTGEYIGNILVLSGASCAEDLDEQEVEIFRHYLSHPLRINLCSRSKLISSGLMSQYQVASLEDYRSRSGDVLSYSELAMVEGFDEEYVAALRPFISLESNSPPGRKAEDKQGLKQDALLRGSVKGKDFSYGLKYKLSAGGIGDISLAARSYYGDAELFPPSAWSGNISFSGKKLLTRAVIGDYNLRLGQGLSLWSGMSLGGFSSSSSFSRRPTGLSPSWSWSEIGSHRGAAAALSAGRFSFIPFISFPGLRSKMEGSAKSVVGIMPGVSLGWNGRSGQIGFSSWWSGSQGKVSVDGRWNIHGADIFGEVAGDLASGAVASVAGTSILIGEGWRISGAARFYPATFDGSWCGGIRSWTKTSDEIGAALGIERYGFQLTADLGVKESDRGRRQVKIFAKIPLQISPNHVLSLRFTERYRPYEVYLVYRTGLRLDLDWASAGLSARYGESDSATWKARLRLEGLLCKSLAGLTYLEVGRKTEKLSAYLRGTLFLVDNWDDRIYSYERDAPGNFTVPAYYGRGVAFSAVGGYKFQPWKRKTLKLYLRVSSKSAVREARLQAVLEI
ncbi:MAG: hypothetical protein IJK70_05430 [Bacteroidales bacterium]|nr:hypothetical protein [Bacteroidales bacterium]